MAYDATATAPLGNGAKSISVMLTDEGIRNPPVRGGFFDGLLDNQRRTIHV